MLVQWSSSAAGEHRAPPGSEFGTSWTGWDSLGHGSEDSLGVSVCEDPCVDDMTYYDQEECREQEQVLLGQEEEEKD